MLCKVLVIGQQMRHRQDGRKESYNAVRHAETSQLFTLYPRYKEVVPTLESSLYPHLHPSSTLLSSTPAA